MDTTYIVEAIKSTAFYGQPEPVIEKLSNWDDVVINDNEYGDTVWSTSTYSNGSLRAIMISCSVRTPKGKRVSACVEAFAYDFDNDFYAMIDWLNSEEIQEILTRRFETNWRLAMEREKRNA